MADAGEERLDLVEGESGEGEVSKEAWIKALGGPFFSRKVSSDYSETADFPHESRPPNHARRRGGPDLVRRARRRNRQTLHLCFVSTKPVL